MSNREEYKGKKKRIRFTLICEMEYPVEITKNELIDAMTQEAVFYTFFDDTDHTELHGIDFDIGVMEYGETIKEPEEVVEIDD